MSQKILVTGAPGWLSNRFIEILLERSDFSIRALCLPQEGAGGFKNSDIEIIHGDIRDETTLVRCTQGVETIFHLAGIIHSRRTQEFFDINTRGTKNLLNAAIRSGVKRFVFVSSNSAAGYQQERSHLLTESCKDNPYFAYGQSKKEAEEIILKATQERKIEEAILRGCWYYGPGQPERQTRFFKMIQKGNPMVFGDGQNLRSMTYLDNMVQGLLLVALKPQAVGQIYWIADEKPYPTILIYETIAKLLSVSKWCPRYLPKIISTVCRYADRMIQKTGRYQQEIHVAGEMTLDIACSIQKAKSELGYRPQVGLEEGMRRSVEWCHRQGVLSS